MTVKPNTRTVPNMPCARKKLILTRLPGNPILSCMNLPTSALGTFGNFVLTPLTLLWQLLNQFLLSPWGMIVPITLLIVLFTVQQVQKTPVLLAQFYAERLETCDETELPRLIKILVQMGDAGVPGLVQGLSSSRESVFVACRNVLQYEFDRWQESPHREHHFLIFSEAIHDRCNQLSPAAQAEAMRFVYQLMQIRFAAGFSPESSAKRQQMIAHCEQILSQLESVRRRRIEPTHSDFDSHTGTVASLDQRTRQTTLLAANGQPFVPASRQTEGLAPSAHEFASFNSFAVPRADRLVAYQKAQQNRPAEIQGNPRLPDDRDIFGSGIASFSSQPTGSVAEMEQKFAQNIPAGELMPPPTPNIADEYRNTKLAESGGTFHSDNFLAQELQNMPLDRVSNLPPTQLMQLLHHSEPAYVESARKTLMLRDGFQEPHMKLAWRLYHPVPAVRQEIVAMLPNTTNVQPAVWLTVLLNDPSNDVRYRAASFLATASDPALRRLLVERGKRDNDARIVNLADRLNESQGAVRRY